MQLQNKRSYFPTSRRLFPNPAHIEIRNCSKIKQTKDKQEKTKTSLKAHNNKQAYKSNNNNNKKQTNKRKKEKKKKIKSSNY